MSVADQCHHHQISGCKDTLLASRVRYCRRHVKTDCESGFHRFRDASSETGAGGIVVTQKLIGPADGALNGTCPSLLPAPDPAVVLA